MYIHTAIHEITKTIAIEFITCISTCIPHLRRTCITRFLDSAHLLRARSASIFLTTSILFSQIELLALFYLFQKHSHHSCHYLFNSYPKRYMLLFFTISNVVTSRILLRHSPSLTSSPCRFCLFIPQFNALYTAVDTITFSYNNFFSTKLTFLI